jgi:peptidoglycan/xylan/chitin deacetylase (PgdA/CDA1 family)
MSKREVAQFLDASGALEAVLRARAWSKTPCLTVLTYHRIHENPGAQDFDDGVIDATPREFDEQVATLRRYFSVIGVEELLAFMKGRPLPPNPAIITFDDGYRESHDLALPILEKHGVKAAFFIATSYVTERRVFWWDRISYIVKHAQHEQIEVAYPEPQVWDLRPQARPLQQLLRFVKSRYALDIERFLEALATAAGVVWHRELERKFADEIVMTWDQVRALRRAGMEVHSHTRTHRVLQSVPAWDLAWELAGARRDVEEQLGEPIRALSYPVGHSIATAPMIRAAVGHAGYELGFSNGSGVSWLWNGFDPLDMRRISVDVGMPLSYFRALVAIPSFADTKKPKAEHDRRSTPDI